MGTRCSNCYSKIPPNSLWSELLHLASGVDYWVTIRNNPYCTPERMLPILYGFARQKLEHQVGIPKV